MNNRVLTLLVVSLLCAAGVARAQDGLESALTPAGLSAALKDLKLAAAGDQAAVAGAPVEPPVRAGRRSGWSVADNKRDAPIDQDLARLLEKTGRVPASLMKMLSTMTVWIGAGRAPSLKVDSGDYPSLYDCFIVVDPAEGVSLTRSRYLVSGFGSDALAHRFDKTLALLLKPQDLEGSPFVLKSIPSLGVVLLYKPLLAQADAAGDPAIALVDEKNWGEALLQVAKDADAAALR